MLLTTEGREAIAALARSIARRFDLAYVAIARPRGTEWDLVEAGPLAVVLDPHQLSQAFAGAQGTLEFDVARRPQVCVVDELAHTNVPGSRNEKRYQDVLEPAQIPERVMVCMSSNALAPRVLRTGARIAGRLGSKWYAVYVETPREQPGRICPADSEALQQNIRLAESLGATVVRVKAYHPSDGLIAFAQREGITHVIFGQSARSRIEILWRGSTLNKFLSAVPDPAVQVVPTGEAVS